jgi:ERF superfamily
VTTTEAEAPAAAVPAGTPRYNAALAAAQAEMPPITKGAKADAGTYSYHYADLGAICVVASPILGKHGLAFTSKPTIEDGKFVLRYRLLHESGEYDGGVMLLPSSGKPQDLGSLLTYYKRYAFCCITGITPVGEDDDAQSSNTSQHFERSAGEAFDNAAPAPARRQQQAPQRPAVTVPPLDDEDPWKAKIEDIADAQEGAAVRAEVAELLETGAIDQERASRLNAVITVKGLALVAAQGNGRPPASRQPASAPPPIRPEDQGARKPAAPAGTDDDAWVVDFTTRLGNATDEDALTVLHREIGAAMRTKKIQADTANFLGAEIRRRRGELQPATA